MARNNRPNQNHKKPTEYRSINPTQTGPSGASAAFSQPQPGAQSSIKSGRPDYSSKQEEDSRGATPERNTIPQSEGRGSGVPNLGARKNEDSEFSEKQDEFETTSPADNTAPQSSSPSAIDPAQIKAQPGPLPDLRHGIPSTLEYETTGSTKPFGLNLTEAEDPSEAAGGGRGKGELPASAYISSSEKKRARFANIMYAIFAGLSVGGTIYLGRNWENQEDEAKHKEDAPSGWALGLMWNRAKARLRDQLDYYKVPAFRKLLPDVDPLFERPYTLVLSMEDLLIHSEWSREHGWRMAKRPGVDYFLRYLSQYYELVIFTSQPSALADPVIRKLDPYHIVTWPLFREATLYENGEYVKVCSLSLI
jgi:import inner membrane translocase subunit TIM50